jgi:hypothetical protein
VWDGRPSSSGGRAGVPHILVPAHLPGAYLGAANGVALKYVTTKATMHWLYHRGVDEDLL